MNIRLFNYYNSTEILTTIIVVNITIIIIKFINLNENL